MKTQEVTQPRPGRDRKQASRQEQTKQAKTKRWSLARLFSLVRPGRLSRVQF
jgi:hypothetical protein